MNPSCGAHRYFNMFNLLKRYVGYESRGSYEKVYLRPDKTLQKHEVLRVKGLRTLYLTL